MKARRVCLVLLIAAFVAGLPLVGHTAPEYVFVNRINVDLYNRTGGSVTGVDFVLSGITCSQIANYFRNTGNYTPGIGLISMNCTSLGGGKIKVSFTWAGSALADGSVAHFGMEFSKDLSPHVEKTYWTNGGVQVSPRIDFAWMYWSQPGPTPPVRMAIYRPDSINLTSVRVANAEYSISFPVIGLEDLTYTDPLVAGLTWTALPALNQVFASALDSASTTIPSPTNTGPNVGIAARFLLQDASGATLLGRYVVETEYNALTPTLTEWGLIILALLAIAAVVWTVYRRRRVMVPA